MLGINSIVKNHLRSVAIAVVGNPNTPINIREHLTHQLFRPSNPFDELCDRDVIFALAYNPKVPEAERKSYFQQIIAAGRGYANAIANDIRTPDPILEQLSQTDEDKEILWKILTEYPKTPVDLLFRFQNEATENNIYCSSMFEKVIKSPALPTLERYRLLLEQEKIELADEVDELISERNDNRNTSSKHTCSSPNNEQTPTLQSLPRIYNPDKDDLPNLLTEYSQSENAFVRFITLIHPLTSEKILTQAANSASWLERYAVAENESTPLETRSILARDGNRIIRVVANQNL